MFLIVLLLLAVLMVPLLGGRLMALLDLRFRGVWLLQTAVAVQVVIIYVAAGSGHAGLQRGVHLATYGGAALFVWLNRDLNGMKLLGLGGAANLAAIATNGGIMPTLPSAAVTAGFASTVNGFQNSAVSTGSPLWFLGDVFAIPAGIPLANVFSIGDIALLAAGVIMVFSATGVHAPRRRVHQLATA